MPIIVQDRNLISASTLDEMTTQYPCLNCLSELQLQMVFFALLNAVFNDINNSEITPLERLDEVKCLNCLSDRQLLQGAIANLITSVSSEFNYTADRALADMRCLQCADPKQVKAGLWGMLAAFFATGWGLTPPQN